MKIAICDDEQICIDKISQLIKSYCTLKHLSYSLETFKNPYSFEKSNLASYDVVFLDAKMGEIDGISAAKTLRSVNSKAILVFISAFIEYAPLGYCVDTFRYLMKSELDTGFTQCMDEIMSKLNMDSKKISIITTEGEQEIAISDLVFLESFRHVILLHLSCGRVLKSKQHTLTELSSLLSPHWFMRIHKSYLVNPKYILIIKNKVVTLTDNSVLNCGKTDYAQTMKAFILWKGKA